MSGPDSQWSDALLTGMVISAQWPPC